MRCVLHDHDPLLERHKRRVGATTAAAATFEIYAVRWHKAQKERWSPARIRKVEQAPRRDVLPDLGRVPISEIDGPMLLEVLHKVEARGTVAIAKRIRQHLSAVFQFATAEDVASADPAAGIVKGLPSKPPSGQQPTVRSIGGAREILRTMDASTSDVDVPPHPKNKNAASAKNGAERSRPAQHYGEDVAKRLLVRKTPNWAERTPKPLDETGRHEFRGGKKTNTSAAKVAN